MSAVASITPKGLKIKNSLRSLDKNTKLNKFKGRRTFKVNVLDNDTEPKPKDSNLIVINGLSEGGHSLRLLVDTAAEAQVISQEAVERLGKEVSPSDCQLVSAQGDNLEVSGVTSLKLEIGTKHYEFDTLVTPVLCGSYDIIVGINFLKHYNTSITTTPGANPKFHIDGVSIPLVR